uniref:NADH-ubiquinone oxidoreductase chain 6 n=1 Tax=Cucujoidea sp. 9 KM-2017 TaxID=2219390 RepID=A0A346RJQ9_9CUCU|nr:NADH dehydrogenase subunit 6 [Cucujoidea sp. 9 KM-2017]
MLFYLNLILSLMMIFINHPLSMGMVLFSQTIIISLLTGMLNLNFWYSYILFLIMIGGMLILFIYMTSIASNEKFKISNKLMLFILITSPLMIILLLESYLTNFFLMNFSMLSMNNLMQFNLSLNKFLNFPMMNIYIIMIIYLFITLIAVVKITNIKYGPLRQKF